MARLITKFKYLKANARTNIGGYAKYIATREGAERIDDSYKLEVSTLKQRQLIEKILKDFPDSKDMLEYEDYLENSTIGNASEFITRALEDNAYEVTNTKTYADYIATRPRAERFGTHGLFTDDGKPLKLKDVSADLNSHKGNVWTVIISLRREDAERLGFNNGKRWRDMLRTQTATLAENFKIPLDNLKWYAAFHNESHHPHIHLMVYASEENKPYLSHKGIMNLRSQFAKDIFAQDLLCVYEKQNEYRDDLRFQSREIISEIISKINNGVYDNPKIEELLLSLADRLSKTGGKKQYGYLKSDVKAIVNNIVTELSKDERISLLYDLWYEQRENIFKIYTQDLPNRIPLTDNKEFKSIKNAVIREAMNILFERSDEIYGYENTVATEDTAEAKAEEIENSFTEKEKTSRMWRLYFEAKELLDTESETYNPNEAVKLLIQSSELGCTVAKYRLGKMFLLGETVPKNTAYALAWLESAVSDGNQYAEYLLGKTLLYGKEAEQDLFRAEKLLKSSSNKGSRYAKYTLGKAYLDGIYLPQNFSEAFRLLRTSADMGFTAAEYLYGKLLYKGEFIPKDIQNAIIYLERAANKNNPYAAYFAGKLRLSEEEIKDIFKAVKNFEIAADNGNGYAEYQLGKLYLYGKETERDFDKAVAYLTSAAEHGNQYAKQLLHSIKINKNYSAALGSLRLLQNLAQIIQIRLDDERKDKSGIDRKLKRKIYEKKQAHGIRQ